MTDDQARIQTLEQTTHSIDKRQESFESFIRAYIEGNEKRLDRIEKDISEINRNLDQELKAIGRHVQNLTLTAMAAIGAMGVSVVAFVWTILATR